MIIENELWRPVNIGNYGKYYSISNFGRLKRLSRISKTDGHLIEEAILSVCVTKKGYKRCVLRCAGVGNRNFYLHRLVALAFVENKNNKPDVNHIDGDKINNNALNLEWCTKEENNEHGFDMGLLKRGRKERVYVSKKSEWGLSKPVIDLNTGVFLHLHEVANIVGTSKGYMAKMLRGEKRNRTNYRYA